MAKSKDWPSVRKGLNGSRQPRWIVDLRPHGDRKYFSSKDEADGEAQAQRIRLQNEGLEGFEFTLEQRLDAKIAMAVLAGSGLSLTRPFIHHSYRERRHSQTRIRGSFGLG
jgi:hypothetical protein